MADSRSALWDGAFVLLGAFVAACAGVAGPLVLQGREDRREESRAQQKARGEARIMFGEFLNAGTQMARLEQDRVLRRFEGADRAKLPALVAERLEGNTWIIVQAALSNVVALKRFVDSQIARGQDRLTDDQACFVHADLRALGEATAIVGTQLTDASTGGMPRPPPLKCGLASRPYGIPVPSS